MRLLPLLLALAFPVLAHASALKHSAVLAVAAVAALGLALAWPLHRHPWRFAVALLLLGAVLAGLLASGHAHLPLLLPPVLITGALGLYFARSLSAGRTPLIQRIVCALHPEALAVPGVQPYTRRLTLLWALLLGLLCATSALLGLLAVPGGLLHALGLATPWPVPLAWWSTVANGLNYVVIGGFFVGEYAWRRRRFPQQPYAGFGDFLRRVAALGPAFWRDGAR